MEGINVTDQKEIIETIDVATDELTEALADLDAKISYDEPEAYNDMHGHVERAQIMLLELLPKCECGEKATCECTACGKLFCEECHGIHCCEAAT